ncbi:MAG: hypothetical protein EOP86_14755 [Verrucomicrobiaceae bacterium]|nr:MAG: hypothetical protein EOP86_14755 [Verrucomicrobiaceae bacterium]
MTIVVICDDDSLIGGLWPGEVDVLISCGDIADAAIQRAMARYRPKHVFAVRGNHDLDAPFPEGVTDLHLETRTLDGVTFGGFEGSWRYKPAGHHLFDQREVSTLMPYFPKVDMLCGAQFPSRDPREGQ